MGVGNTPDGWWQKWSSITLGAFLKRLLIAVVAAGVLVVSGFTLYVGLPVHSIPALETVDQYVYLDQGWGEEFDSAGRETYYYTGQGASLPQGATYDALRYDWFVHLEMPLGKKRFAEPDHMRAYRFLVDAEPSLQNPDQLPVGFAKHFEPTVGEYLLDLSCAACHSGQLHYNKDGTNYAIRVDGGQAMHNFTGIERGSFGSTLLASLVSTRYNPLKFNRFARNVIGDGYPEGKDKLKSDLKSTIKRLLSSGQNNPLRHLYPVAEGYGRTDALGRIANTVFGDHLVSGNYQAGDAPVSYPYVWNIWKFDWVQYNGSVKQPLSRNIGESLGVGARILLTDSYGRPLPPEQRFTSSTHIPNLQKIEHNLQSLKPPKWPSELFGSIDQQKASRGKELFEERCHGCHGPHLASAAQQHANAPGKPDPALEWLIEVIPVEHIGTDPTAATGFVERRYNLEATGLTALEVRDVLKPLRLRALSRDTQYRLTEVVALREAQNLSVAELKTLLADYPNPNASRDVAIPDAVFKRIAKTMAELVAPLPELARLSQPPLPYNCDLSCQQSWLLWNVSNGEFFIEQELEEVDISKVTEGEGLNILGIMIKNKYYKDNRIGYAEQECIEGFGALDLPQQIAGYKPRPLEGVWATPPFLHNGSVPSLYQMLLPPSQRDKTFYVGVRDFDPKHVGYTADSTDADAFLLDTSITGNLNTGHAFTADKNMWANRHTTPLPSGVIGPLLTEDERWSLVEYLKIHQDDAPEVSGYTPPDCSQSGQNDHIVAEAP